MRNSTIGKVFCLALPAAICLTMAGCPLNPVYLNNTAEVEGSIAVIFVNNTDAAAVFSTGTWNDLDRLGIRDVNLTQLRVSPHSSSENANLTCARNFAVATQRLVDWVRETEEPESDTFIPERLNATVFFTNQDVDTPGENSPSMGTAEGIELLLGVHYSCLDQLIVTFEEDATAAGGYRIDYLVITDE